MKKKSKKNKEEHIPLVLIMLILISTLLLTGGFIYTTYDDDLDRDSDIIKAGVTRDGLYILFGITSFFIFTMFWGFVYYSSKNPWRSR